MTAPQPEVPESVIEAMAIADATLDTENIANFHDACIAGTKAALLAAHRLGWVMRKEKRTADDTIIIEDLEKFAVSIAAIYGHIDVTILVKAAKRLRELTGGKDVE